MSTAQDGTKNMRTGSNNWRPLNIIQEHRKATFKSFDDKEVLYMS